MKGQELIDDGNLIKANGRRISRVAVFGRCQVLCIEVWPSSGLTAFRKFDVELSRQVELIINILLI